MKDVLAYIHTYEFIYIYILLKWLQGSAPPIPNPSPLPTILPPPTKVSYERPCLNIYVCRYIYIYIYIRLSLYIYLHMYHKSFSTPEFWQSMWTHTHTRVRSISMNINGSHWCFPLLRGLLGSNFCIVLGCKDIKAFLQPLLIRAVPRTRIDVFLCHPHLLDLVLLVPVLLGLGCSLLLQGCSCL